MTYRVEALRDDHDPADFECGNSSLTDWLKTHARLAKGQGTRTYVLIDEAAATVAGYFAIAPHLIAREEVPPRLGRGAPRHIPAILLAKLALDRRLQRRGLGSELLVRALEAILEAARIAGGKLVVVDAIDETAVRFYQHHDFEPSPLAPSRLFMKLSTVAKVLGSPWP